MGRKNKCFMVKSSDFVFSTLLAIFISLSPAVNLFSHEEKKPSNHRDEELKVERLSFKHIIKQI